MCHIQHYINCHSQQRQLGTNGRQMSREDRHQHDHFKKWGSKVVNKHDVLTAANKADGKRRESDAAINEGNKWRESKAQGRGTHLLALRQTNLQVGCIENRNSNTVRGKIVDQWPAWILEVNSIKDTGSWYDPLDWTHIGNSGEITSRNHQRICFSDF